jgi:hypothetical protein
MIIKKKRLFSTSDSRKSKYPKALIFVFKFYSKTENVVLDINWEDFDQVLLLKHEQGLHPQTKILSFDKFFKYSEIFALTAYYLCVVFYASLFSIALMSTSLYDPKFSSCDWIFAVWDTILKFQKCSFRPFIHK